MKKLVSVLLAALMLLCCGAAMAEAPAPFSFRGGLTWGMTAEEVIAIEGVQPDSTEEYSYHITKLVYKSRQVSSYTCPVTYWFVDGGLAQAEMKLGVGESFYFLDLPETVVDMTNALTYAYGEPTGVDAMSVSMTAITTGIVPTTGIVVDIDAEHVFDTWAPAEGTEITLISHDGYIYLRYVNNAIDWANAINEPAPVVTPVPDITGL